MMPLHSGMGVDDYLSVVYRRKWLILLAFACVFMAAFAYYSLTPKVYRSSSTILIIPRRVPENYVRSTVNLAVQDRMSTLNQQVMSRTLLISIIKELGLYKEDRRKFPEEVLIERMQKDIEITPIRAGGRTPTTEAVSIAFKYKDPLLAMMTASRLASFFIDENLKGREQQAVGTSQFLDSQLQETKANLMRQEEMVKRYKMTFMGELPQQVEANLNQLTRLQDQLKSNVDAIRSAEDRRIFLEAQIGLIERAALESSASVQTPATATVTEATPVATPPDPVQTTMLADLNTKRARLAFLTAKYTELYPEIIQLRREIVELENRLNAHLASLPPPRTGTVQVSGAPLTVPPTRAPALQSVRSTVETQRLKAQVVSTDAEIKSLKKSGDEIRGQVAAIQSKVDRSPRREQEMIALGRDYENLKRKYDDLLSKKLEADVSQNLEKHEKGEQFQVVDPPNLPTIPLFPNPVMVLGIAIVAACGIGFGGAFGLEAINPVLRGVKDFKHFFKIPVMASIPLRLPGADPNRFAFLRRFRKKAEDSKNDSPLRKLHDGPGWTNRYIPLQSRIENLLDTRGIKVLAVTSAIPGDGKTVTTTGLAASFALSGSRKVLLMDLDLKKPDIARNLGISRTPGISEYLSGTASINEIIRDSGVPGLSVITAGVGNDHLEDVLGKETFRVFLKELRDRFDVVLLDTSPIVPLEDTLSLRNQADAFLLIYRMGGTPHPLFSKTIEEIGEENIIGVVLNGVEERKSEYYKKRYYKQYAANNPGNKFKGKGSS